MLAKLLSALHDNTATHLLAYPLRLAYPLPTFPACQPTLCNAQQHGTGRCTLTCSMLAPCWLPARYIAVPHAFPLVDASAMLEADREERESMLT